MKKPSVLITRRLPDVATQILSEKFDVHCSGQNVPMPADQLLEAVQKFDAILTTVSEKFPREVLNQSKNLRAISNYAVGLDNIDLSAAKDRDIRIYNTPDVVTNSTADYTFALLLSLIRKTSAANEFVASGQWKAWDPFLLLGEELHGKTFGIIGFGKIGQAVAKRALGFGLKIIFSNPRQTTLPAELQNQAEAVSMDELLLRSDYISIHAPLTGETKGLINAAAFAKMQRKPLLLNMARGPLVVTQDLISALGSGLIRGAALDVTDPEPLPGDHALIKAMGPNCILSPHIGTATVECRNAMARLAATNILNHFYS